MAAGPVEHTGFGATGISPQRLESWSRLTAWPLSPWEAEVILQMSAAYAGQLNADKDAPAPYADAIDKHAAAKAVRAALRMGAPPRKD